MVHKITISLTLACALVMVQAYSGGAPPEVCESMEPGHPATAQKDAMPYTLTVDKDVAKAGDVVKMTIRGKEGFKGFFLQVRQGKKNDAIGKFIIDASHKYIKTIDCGKGEQNAATHKNSEIKNDIEIDWKVPSAVKGEVQAYLTVAKDGDTYWVARPVAKINIS